MGIFSGRHGGNIVKLLRLSLFLSIFSFLFFLFFFVFFTGWSSSLGDTDNTVRLFLVLICEMGTVSRRYDFFFAFFFSLFLFTVKINFTNTGIYSC